MLLFYRIKLILKSKGIFRQEASDGWCVGESGVWANYST